jgi:predicted small lipoprotein YifL
MRHPLPSVAACTALACLLAACGQTGPLYLPDAGVTTPVEIRPAPAPAPAAGPATPGPTGSSAPAPGEPKEEETGQPPPGGAGS